MMKRLLAILAVVALAALAHLWPLETFLGVCALGAVGLALVVGAGLGYGVGRAAAVAELATKELSETEAHAALVRLMQPLDEGQRRRLIMMACHRYVVEPEEKKIERETLMALFMPGKRAM